MGGLRVAGVWMVLFGLLSLVGLAIHPAGEEALQRAQTMQVIRASTAAWRVSHFLFGLGFLFGSMAGLVVLTNRSRLADAPSGIAGWSMVAIANIPVSLGGLLEATVIADVALANDPQAFDVWYGGFLGTTTALLAVSLVGIFLIAVYEIRAASPLLPRWASAVAGVGALASIGIVPGFLLVMPALNALYLAIFAPIIWLTALGIQLIRRAPAGKAVAQ